MIPKCLGFLGSAQAIRWGSADIGDADDIHFELLLVRLRRKNPPQPSLDQAGVQVKDYNWMEIKSIIMIISANPNPLLSPTITTTTPSPPSLVFLNTAHRPLCVKQGVDSGDNIPSALTHADAPFIKFVTPSVLVSRFSIHITIKALRCTPQGGVPSTPRNRKRRAFEFPSRGSREFVLVIRLGLR